VHFRFLQRGGVRDGDRLPRQPLPGRDARDGGRYARLLGVERDGLRARARLTGGAADGLTCRKLV